MEKATRPVGGVDDPRTFQEFDEWFLTEELCLACIWKIRWPNGFICPHGGAQPKTPSWMGADCYSAHTVKNKHQLLQELFFTRPTNLSELGF